MVNGVLEKTAPDVTLASVDISLNFSWKVLNENLGSDHLVIKFSSDTPGYATSEKKKKFQESGLDGL